MYFSTVYDLAVMLIKFLLLLLLKVVYIGRDSEYLSHIMTEIYGSTNI